MPEWQQGIMTVLLSDIRSSRELPFPDRQRAMIEEQAEQLVEAISRAREEDGKNWSIKQMESRKKKKKTVAENRRTEQ